MPYILNTFLLPHCNPNSQRLAMRAQVADVFLAKFQLKPEEARVLRGTRDGVLHPVSFLYDFCVLKA